MSQQSYISGWDIGGAHLKVARCSPQGQLIDVRQFPCALWQGIDQLELAIQQAQQTLNNQDDIAAVTMTGELVDLFENRQAGVAAILDCVSQFIPDQKCHVFAGENGWLHPNEAKIDWPYVASRNWQASANFTALKINHGVFIDIGSTTCDIIPIANHKVVATGYDDHARQTSRELLYTGTIRTPLIALSASAPFNGQLVSLAAEVFATTGDIWVLQDLLNPDDIQDASSDGESWKKTACARRLARLLGTDAIDPTGSEWYQLSSWFAQQQRHQICNAILQVLSAHPSHLKKTVIGAGVGRFIIEQCALQLGLDYIDFASLTQSSLASSSDHAPAAAVTLLAQQELT